MLKRRTFMFLEHQVLDVIYPAIICSRKSFKITTPHLNKLYAPPMIIKKQDKSVANIIPKDKPEESNYYVNEDKYTSSLSKYLFLQNNEFKTPLMQLFASFSPSLAGATWHPKLKLDEDGYLMNAINDRIKNSNDIVIIGGGLVGYSIAHHINRLFRGDVEVTIIENDFKVPQLAPKYAMGLIRQQLPLKELINMSKYASEFLEKVKEELSFENFEPEIDLKYGGYLRLAEEKQHLAMRKESFFQSLEGVRAENLSNAALKDKFPWMNVHDIEGGNMGLKEEGWYDNEKLLEAFKLNSEYFGNTYLEGEVIDCEMDVDLDGRDHFVSMSKISSLKVQLSEGGMKSIDCGTVVLAAGASTSRIAKVFEVGTSDYPLSPFAHTIPLETKYSYVTQFTVPNGPGLNFPLVLDSSGISFRKHGLEDSFICEWQPPSDMEPMTDCDEVNEYFNKTILPKLANRVAVFKNAKITSSTCCPYDHVTYDKNPIIGFHPGATNLFLACGLGENGLHGLAVGKYLTELLLDMKLTINLKRFNISRIEVDTDLPTTKAPTFFGD